MRENRFFNTTILTMMCMMLFCGCVATTPEQKNANVSLYVNPEKTEEQEMREKNITKPNALFMGDISVKTDETCKLEVSTDVENPEMGTSYQFYSDNVEVAKVSKDGTVTGVSDGVALIEVRNEFGLSATCNVTVSTFPIEYSDDTGKITITKEWFENAWCYIAHLEFCDYSRFGTYVANGIYGSTSPVSYAAEQLKSILCVNGCYSAPNLGYAVMRGGIVYNDRACTVPAVYSNQTGVFSSPSAAGVYGVYLSGVTGTISDTFCFGPEFLVNGTVIENSDTSRAQRTFIGSNGQAGDIYLVVSDGRLNDGESAGLTYTQCARLLQSKGCTFGIPLDGGGSSEMVYKGKILNKVGKERDYLVDFIYFK